jgi:hypothetical protein
MEDRKVYIDKLSAQLKEWDDKILELETKARTATAGAQAELQHQINTIKEKQESLTRKVQELREAAPESWKELQKGAQRGWDELKSAMNKAVSGLKR